MNNLNRSLSLTLAVGAALAGAAPAQAQQASGLEEIFVTAQKRS